MDFATRNWFRHINENIRLDEGVRNLGLTEMIADFIESALHSAPESAKTWMGHMWKKTHLHQFMAATPRQQLRFDTMEPLLSALDYWTGGTKKDDLPVDEPTPDVQFESILKENVEWSAEKAQRTKFILQTINKTLKTKT